MQEWTETICIISRQQVQISSYIYDLLANNPRLKYQIYKPQGYYKYVKH